MAAGESSNRDLQDELQGLRSSINYSIDSVSDRCREISRHLSRTEERLDCTQTEISELIRSLDKVRKTCVQCRKELLDSGREIDETKQKYSLTQLERLMALKCEFEQRETCLREEKDRLQEVRRVILENLKETEDLLNRLRFAREMLFAPAGTPSQVRDNSTVSLAALTIQFAERERLSLARELHDGPAQLFSAAILLLELVEKLLSMGDSGRAIIEVGRVKEQMKESLTDIRSFLWHLNPQALEGGLKRGLMKLVDQVQERSETSVEIQFHGRDNKVDAVNAANLFRIVQEAINNAIKNGNARNIKISITACEGELRGRVEDDGCGFDVESAKKRSRQKGSFGLSNMEERARLIGGTLSLDSTPGRGTVVSFRVPIAGGVHREEDKSRSGR